MDDGNLSLAVCLPIFIAKMPVESHERGKAEYEVVVQPSKPYVYA
jgi:hypothetical protein